MDIKLLTKKPVDLPKIALLLGLIYLVYNFGLNIPITTHLFDTPFPHMVFQHMAPLFVLPLFIFNAVKQSGKSSKIAAISYAAYTLLAVLTLSLQDVRIVQEYAYRYIYDESTPTVLNVVVTVSGIVNVIASSLQILAIVFFAYSNRKSSITFRVAIAFALSLFAMTALSKWSFIFMNAQGYRYINIFYICDFINRLFICVATIVVFAVRNRKNLPLCISVFVSIPILFALTIIPFLCDCYPYVGPYESYFGLPKILVCILLFGISVAISIMLLSKKEYKIDFLDILILLAITLSMFDSSCNTMFWTVGLFAAIAADYLKTKFPTNKHINIAMISIFMSMMLCELMGVIGVNAECLTWGSMGLNPGNWVTLDFDLIQSIKCAYGLGVGLILSVPIVGIWVGSKYIITAIVLTRLFKLTKSAQVAQNSEDSENCAT